MADPEAPQNGGQNTGGPEGEPGGMAQEAQDEAVSKPRRRHRRVRAPTVLQMEAVECGAASLAMVLAYYGKFVALEQLRIDCGVSRDGSNAASVLGASRLHGMTGSGYKMEPEHLRDIALPAIIFWEFNHFLVVEGFGRHAVYLNDPASGRRTVTHAEFDRSFTGIVLVMEPGPEFKKSGQRPSVIRGLASRFKGVSAGVAFCVLTGLGMVVPGLAIPTLAKVFVDNVLVANFTNWIAPVLLGMVAAAGMRGMFTALQRYYLMRASTKLSVVMTGKFLWHVLRLPTTFFAQRYAGDVSGRVASNDRVAQILTGELAANSIGLLTAVFYAVLMAWYDPILMLVGVSLSMLNLVALRMVASLRADESQRMLQEQGKLMATSMGGLQIIESIKAAGRESDFFSRWSGFQAKAVDAEQKLRVSGAFLDMLPLAITVLTTAIIVGVGGHKVMDGAMTMGALVAFLSLMASFSNPIMSLVRLGSVIQEVEGDIRRLDDVANHPVDQVFDATPDHGVTVATRRLKGFLELRNITFGYSRFQEPLIRDFSLSLAPGDRVAIVGGSGSGKSTIAKLVAGLYRPWEGQILFDGKPREQLSRALLANSCAMVDQDIFFFEGAVRENIALWDSTIPDEAITRAAKDACIHERITTRRGAYAGLVEEGGRNFSGGQRQRMEISRALAIDPTILILDEATSALDPSTEKQVDDNIRRRGCTCIVIAHRLSTIRDANEIIVLDRGRVVQRGTHHKLKGVEGHYAHLISSE